MSATTDEALLRDIEAVVELLNSRMNRAIAQGIEFDLTMREVQIKDQRLPNKVVEIENYRRTEWLDWLIQ